MTLDKARASSEAGDVMIGAMLDEIRVLSLQMTLRFLMQGNGKPATYVDVAFACDACVGNDIQNDKGLDFFARRSIFLPDVYKHIGSEVTDVAVNGDGTLTIGLGSLAKISIVPVIDDEFDGDWSWQIQSEENSRLATLSCVYEEGRIFYVSA